MMIEYFEDSALEELYQKRKTNFKNFAKAKFDIGIDEEKETAEDEKILVDAIIEAVGKDIYTEKIREKLSEFQVSIFAENDLWNEVFYKLGYIDSQSIKQEVNKYQIKDISNIETFEELFDEEIIKRISSFIEEKSDKLLKIQDFKEKDSQFNKLLEEIENNISSDLKDKMDELVRKMYQLESYYFTLAYFIGAKNAQNIKAL